MFIAVLPAYISLRVSDLEITGSCELNLCPLEEQSELLTTKPSLQP